MTSLRQTPLGVVICLKAFPGARKSELGLDRDGHVRVFVTQTAERGKANTAIIALLAKSLGISKSRIELLRGATGRQKSLLLRDCSLAEVSQRLAK